MKLNQLHFKSIIFVFFSVRTNQQHQQPVHLLETRLENETLRRQHCEKQIHELNEHLLEVQQQLTIANCMDKRRDLFVQGMDASLQRVLADWRARQQEAVTSLRRAKLERQQLAESESKARIKAEFVDKELTESKQSLVEEKVRCQELANEVATLKKALNDALQSYIDRSNEVERQGRQLAEMHEEKRAAAEEAQRLRQSLAKAGEELEANRTEMEELKAKNRLVVEKNEKLKSDYESLIKEAKYMVGESENQVNRLLREAETERLARDGLQMEVNVLEEKLEKTVAMLTRDYEARIEEMGRERAEEGRRREERFRADVELEAERARLKGQREVQRTVEEYEEKLSAAGLTLDACRREVERLKRVNADIEADRCMIRQSLKGMLEVQMKEAMELLGVNKGCIESGIERIEAAVERREQPRQEVKRIEEMAPEDVMMSYEESINQLFSKFKVDKTRER